MRTRTERAGTTALVGSGEPSNKSNAPRKKTTLMGDGRHEIRYDKDRKKKKKQSKKRSIGKEVQGSTAINKNPWERMYQVVTRRKRVTSNPSQGVVIDP